MESMTGFGSSIFQGENFQIHCQAKSINHRYLEVTLRIPRRYSSLEERIRKRVLELFERGKIEIQIKIYGFPKEVKDIAFDLELARKIKFNLETLKATLNLGGEITLAEILSFREIVLLEEKEEDLESLWIELEPSLEEALAELKNSRLREGALLRGYIEKFLEELSGVAKKIEALKEKVREENLKKMKERIERNLSELSSQLDEGRFYQEVALFLDRLDFTEELDRFKVHLQEMQNLLDEKASGKRLDFLCQELYREINTLSNKAQSAEISQLAVIAKDLIEKIREQVQNVV
ncbi:hypothetical protein THC_0941 [Caldimicrobium thiodismutans]|jgi:uncharacterized protein (TIGR00255 family)|uniref:YicC family protein n=1 Tax=Caldimicrobium thiodismutans TaxID=1653476 RepID=A0A0U5AXF9_9BACT|nr:YicC/YloC family endoribonuclease [Caldimicrobium thiodismutans]BAU23326.1 hypothetical protein THC_0941 [Caldimicrobium thiodismutans]